MGGMGRTGMAGGGLHVGGGLGWLWVGARKGRGGWGIQIDAI